MTMRLVVAVVVSSLGSGCVCTGDSRAAALPQSANVALGASHDVLVVACQDRVTLLDFVFPVAATALFVGFGRLDAAFYLPDALVEAAVPQCKDTRYSVSGAKLEGAAFELEPTANDKAYKLHSRAEGESTFSAVAKVGNESIEVSTTLTALKPDRLELTLQCDTAWTGEEVLQGWVPVGGTVGFQQRLFRGTTPLTGYGLIGFSSPGLVVEQQHAAGVAVTVSAPRGPFTVTSPLDPAFSLQLTAYDATDVDRFVLERVTPELLFVGQKTQVRPIATIGGKVPCRSGGIRTLTIETPSVCRFLNPDGPTALSSRNYPVDVEALAPGPCRMSMVLPGSPLTASLELPVFRGFEATPLPEAATKPPYYLLDLHVEASEDLFLAGWKDEISGRTESATLRRLNGAWGTLQTARPPRHLQAIHGARGTGAIFAVGYSGSATRWDGAKWAQVDAGTAEDLNDVWVNGANDVYAAGEKGTLLHYDGAQWASLDAGVTADLRRLWGDGAGNLYVVGWSGTVKRYDGASFTDLLPGAAGDAGFNANFVTGSGPADVWVNTTSQALHWDGVSWQSHRFGSGGGNQIKQVWPVGDGYAYVLMQLGVGGSLPRAQVVRFDGTKSVVIPLPGDARAITGIGNEVFILSGKALLRYRHDPADVFP